MKRALAIAAVVAGVAHVAGVARAEGAPTIQVPSGWQLDTAHSEEQTKRLQSTSHFGLDPAAHATMANADVYVPRERGVVLSVVLVAASTTEELPAAARAAVDELHAASQRAALAGGGIVEEGWQEKVDTAGKQIEATLAWRDTAAKTSSTARLLVVADATHIQSLTGECFASDDADAALVTACKAALATLNPGIPVEQRVALALAPAGTRPTPPAGPTREPARMNDGTRAPLPPMALRHEDRATDRRPVYVGIALVVLAAVFYWNRRRHAREDQS